MTAKIFEYPHIIFCDFDGTITETESLEKVFFRFAPDTWKPVKEDLVANRITVREAVSRTIDSIPSADYGDILEFTRTFPIRPGFTALLDFLDAHQVPLVVLSGGIRGMVETRLEDFKDRVHAIFAADVDTSGQCLRTNSAYAGETELVDKISVMNLFDANEKIAIGDGITDFNMARAADLVFARAGLARFLEQNRISFQPWSDFFDIQNYLKTHFSFKHELCDKST